MYALSYLKEYTLFRLGEHFGENTPFPDRLVRPEETDPTSFAQFIRHYNPSEPEIIVLLTALAPLVIPGFFDALILQFIPQGGEFPEFGGVKENTHRGTLPTGATEMFLLPGIHPA